MGRPQSTPDDRLQGAIELEHDGFKLNRSALTSPLPAGESVGRLWRPSLLKNAEAKLRLSRIVRCAAGEGPIRESGCVERPLTRSLRCAPASTSPHRGEVRRSPRQPNCIML